MLIVGDDDLVPDDHLATTPAARRVLDAASELFYRRGIHVVGVDLVAERAGTTKKTLYDRFGSKDGLVVAYLTHRAHRWRAFLRSRLAEVTDDAGAAARVAAVFDALAAWMVDQDRGCAFVNALAELGGADYGDGVVPALELVRAEKRWMHDVFAAVLAGGTSVTTAAQLHVLYEGATVLATVAPGTGAVTAARDAAVRLLADA